MKKVCSFALLILLIMVHTAFATNIHVVYNEGTGTGSVEIEWWKWSYPDYWQYDHITCPGNCTVTCGGYVRDIRAITHPNYDSYVSYMDCTNTYSCHWEEDPIEDQYVTVTFTKRPLYHVTPSISGHGNITPNIIQDVYRGYTTSFDIESDPGYIILDGDVTGCGGSLSLDYSHNWVYTTGAINNNCTVSASIYQRGGYVSLGGDVTVLLDGSVVSSAGTVDIQGGQFISELRKWVVPYPETMTITLSPNSIYNLGPVSGCGGTLNGHTYVTSPIAQDCSINVDFVPIIYTYTVTATAGTHGSISPANTTVQYSAEDSGCVDIIITPDSGYKLATLTDNGYDRYFNAQWSGINFNYTYRICSSGTIPGSPNHTVNATFEVGEPGPIVPPPVPSQSTVSLILAVLFMAVLGLCKIVPGLKRG